MANVVVTCTKRKLRQPLDPLQLRRVANGSLEDRAQAWIRALKRTTGESLPAHALYAGNHWSAVRTLPDAAEAVGRSVRIWVLSAGYGLLSWDSPVLPYSATFSREHPDSVVHKGSDTSPARARSDWWEALAAWDGPSPGLPRTLTELAQRDSGTPLLVAASEVYLGAVQKDLITARDALDDDDLLSIISAGTSRLGDLSSSLVPCDARLKSLLGGGMHSLNARIVHRLLQDAPRGELRYAGIAKRFSRVLATLDAYVPPQRRPMSDAQVRQFVQQALKRNPETTRSPLLRQLRDSGRACEQKRFGDLFMQVAQTKKPGKRGK